MNFPRSALWPVPRRSVLGDELVRRSRAADAGPAFLTVDEGIVALIKSSTSRASSSYVDLDVAGSATVRRAGNGIMSGSSGAHRSISVALVAAPAVVMGDVDVEHVA